MGTDLPTLRQLELLVALSGAPSIAAAGARIGMSASATSHALRALESCMGCEVLDRVAAGVVFTHAGELALPHARDVFASLQQLKTVAAASQGLQVGLLRIGSIGPSTSLHLLPPLLEKFRRRYPGIDVHVSERVDADIEQDLRERKIELGVVRLPQPTLDTVALSADELVAVLPLHHPLAQNETVSVRELAHYPLILTRAGSQDLVMRMFEREGLRPKVAHELLQVVSILEFVTHGNGVSVIPSSTIPQKQVHSALAFRPVTPRVTRRVAIACVDSTRLSPAGKAFWELARREAASKSAAARDQTPC